MTDRRAGGDRRRGERRKDDTTAWRLLVGRPRDVRDPHVFHRVSLAAFLAWVGLGADGLSSSAYGPEEAWRALGPHSHLAILLALMMTATILVISVAYSNLIEHFPGGGGGYLVASKLLGRHLGLVSGSALLVDYVLTITVSVASGCDQLWSVLPPHWHAWKLPAELFVLAALAVLNLRGVKESVTILAPIFALFLVTHAFMILWTIGSRAGSLPEVVHGTTSDLADSIRDLGWLPVVALLLRAYSLGGGTYTGIEAVSNGVGMLREPRVRTGKRTMALMAASLAFTAGGILLCYLLTDARPVAGKTMNAVLFDGLFGSWTLGGLSVGAAFVVVALAAEAALLFVAAQAGFIDGPRVLANMALDSWMPHRLSQLSDRLVAQNGVLIMSVAAVAALIYTRGDVGTLVVMYSINVFLTFTLTELGMCRHWIGTRREEPRWRRLLVLHGTGLLMCVTILGVTVVEKAADGGWVTLAATACFVALALCVRSHYDGVRKDMSRLDAVLAGDRVQRPSAPAAPLDPRDPTAIICVGSFSGFGLHQLLSIERSFPRHFRNHVFVSAAVLDSGTFKGREEVGHLTQRVQQDLERYVAWATGQGLRAEWRMGLGTEAVTTVQELCRDASREFPRSVVFLGKLIFEDERWYHRLLHSETAMSLQRRLQFDGVQAVVLPVRVMDSAADRPLSAPEAASRA